MIFLFSYQQLQCSVVEKESARRYFEAVQGNGVYKGELFGIKNLFRLQTEGTCLTRRILEVRHPTGLLCFIENVLDRLIWA